MAGLGHGTALDMTAEAALAVALAVEPNTAEGIEPHEVQDLRPGQAVSVAPDNNSAIITGTLLALARDEIVLNRQHPRVGKIAIHFPRVGYRISGAPGA